jgi:hypothetical protein
MTLSVFELINGFVVISVGCVSLVACRLLLLLLCLPARSRLQYLIYVQALHSQCEPQRIERAGEENKIHWACTSFSCQDRLAFGGRLPSNNRLHTKGRYSAGKVTARGGSREIDTPSFSVVGYQKAKLENCLNEE